MGFDELSVRAMSLAIRTKNYPEGAPCVFVRYAGHVQSVEIELYEQGWKSGVNADINVIVYADRDRSKFLSETLDYIENVLDAYDLTEGHKNES